MTCFGSPEEFQGQSYSKIKKDCLKRGEKFSDPKFPPHDSSIYFSKQPPGVISWKRPHELVENPHLFVEGVSSNDVSQGQLGNCWFVAACATLAGVKELWQKVIPDFKEQEYGAGGLVHPGVFYFRFWRFGEWVEVVVDDLLPTIDGQLIFAHSKEKGEFWCALLEKAYAKLHGSYEALEGGNLSDALVDLTSGVSAHLELTTGGYVDDFEKRKQLFKMMQKEHSEHALMCCTISAHTHNEIEMRTENGLVKGHAYGITALRKANIGDTSLFSLFKGREKIRMIRLKNPWGEKEWTGAFSDRSSEWSKVTPAEREKLGLTFEDDGEFWMTFEDFVENFTDLSICFLINTSMFSLSKTWSESQFSSGWTIGVKGHCSDRAGGCPNHKDSFLRNPQYRFDVKEEEDDVLIQLMQRDAREKRKEGVLNLVIGFHIMKVEANRRYRVHTIHEPVATSDYIRTRSIFLREQLKRGRYVIVPTTFKPNETGEFLLRLFSSKDPDAKELIDDQPKIAWYSCVKKPAMLTTVSIKSASDLQKQTAFGGEPDPYCIIRCEGETLKTPVVKATTNPKWDYTAIFYRAKPDEPVAIEVWNYNLIVDGFMGRAEVLAPITSSLTQVELPLFGRRKEKSLQKEGVIIVQVYSDDDLTSV
ncbi:UNVERIFIED_CONTAM: hypothetical protein RMT77_017116 [Armadillidium vulgare]